MNAELEKKAEQTAWELVYQHIELFEHVIESSGVGIITAALLAWGNERLEKAALIAYDELVGLPDCQRRIARAIRRLKE